MSAVSFIKTRASRFLGATGGFPGIDAILRVMDKIDDPRGERHKSQLQKIFIKDIEPELVAGWLVAVLTKTEQDYGHYIMDLESCREMILHYHHEMLDGAIELQKQCGLTVLESQKHILESAST